eukprot:gene11247-biopygen3827
MAATDLSTPTTYMMMGTTGTDTNTHSYDVRRTAKMNDVQSPPVCARRVASAALTPPPSFLLGIAPTAIAVGGPADCAFCPEELAGSLAIHDLGSCEFSPEE